MKMSPPELEHAPEMPPAPCTTAEWEAAARGIIASEIIRVKHDLTHGMINARMGSEGYIRACKAAQSAEAHMWAVMQLLGIKAKADLIAEVGPIRAYLLNRKLKLASRKNHGRSKSHV